MRFILLSLFVSISCKYGYILASTYDVTSNSDFQAVKHKRTISLQNSGECINENCFISDNNQPNRGDEDKNVYSTLATQKTSNEDVIINTHEYGEPHYFRTFPDLSNVKRASQGFFGMRGKKEYENYDFDKRRPTGFQGVRGKKYYLNYPISFIPPKRFPAGFMGMRGKKNAEEQESLKRSPSGFQGMRGKKDFNLSPNTTYESDENDIDDDDLTNLLNILRTKQTFFNLHEPTKMVKNLFDKGRQELRHLMPPEIKYHTTNDLNHLYYNSIGNFNKRVATDYQNLLKKKSLENIDFFSEKRAPVGFQGVRGKKDVNNVLRNLVADKRSSVGFFDTRGKKEPTGSNFFGMRGKKVPFDLRSKFVGMRGKKSNSLDATKFGSTYHEMAQDERVGTWQ